MKKPQTSTAQTDTYEVGERVHNKFHNVKGVVVRIAPQEAHHGLYYVVEHIEKDEDGDHIARRQLTPSMMGKLRGE